MSGDSAKRLCIKFGLCKHKSVPNMKNMISKLNKNLIKIQSDYVYNFKQDLGLINSTKNIFTNVKSNIPIDIINNIYSYLYMTPNQKQIYINRFHLQCEINHIDHYSIGQCSFIRTEKKTFCMKSCKKCGNFIPMTNIQCNCN